MPVVVMGVSGAGKTTVGRMLAAALDGTFVDADDFHPPWNIAKMAAGLPLDDDDRRSWLATISQILCDRRPLQPLVIACSALKRDYRAALGPAPFFLVYLKGRRGTIAQRIEARKGHFIPTALLDSQFATLEEPLDALTLDIERPPEILVQDVLDALRARSTK
ncbi:MAG: gluconate kinase [Rhodospirillales bacterium CG15_BIG_FIL_POST_REV_8_21_14_020_66_15]|nr:MAG: gluconate kinase [Rhodospirillales bacterium CG15_BIG_FIL_POST_REV_8_21_14_020_66_15]